MISRLIYNLTGSPRRDLRPSSHPDDAPSIATVSRDNLQYGPDPHATEGLLHQPDAVSEHSDDDRTLESTSIDFDIAKARQIHDTSERAAFMRENLAMKITGFRSTQIDEVLDLMRSLPARPNFPLVEEYRGWVISGFPPGAFSSFSPEQRTEVLRQVAELQDGTDHERGLEGIVAGGLESLNKEQIDTFLAETKRLWETQLANLLADLPPGSLQNFNHLQISTLLAQIRKLHGDDRARALRGVVTGGLEYFSTPNVKEFLNQTRELDFNFREIALGTIDQKKLNPAQLSDFSAEQEAIRQAQQIQLDELAAQARADAAKPGYSPEEFKRFTNVIRNNAAQLQDKRPMEIQRFLTETYNGADRDRAWILNGLSPGAYTNFTPDQKTFLIKLTGTLQGKNLSVGLRGVLSGGIHDLQKNLSLGKLLGQLDEQQRDYALGGMDPADALVFSQQFPYRVSVSAH